MEHRLVRLIQLADYAAPYPGSFVPMLKAVLGSASRRGWEVEAIFGSDARGAAWIHELEATGTRVRLLSLTGRRALRADLAGLLDESREPTILHTHFTAFDLPAALAATRRAQTAVVWHLHSPARADLVGHLRAFAKLRLTARLADRLLCVAPDLAHATAARGAPRSRVSFFPNAIDTTSFAPVDGAGRSAARATYALRPETKALLHFGWDWRRKGGDVFLHGVRQLVHAGRDVTGLVVGGGSEASRLVRSLSLGEAAVVIPPGERVQELYAAADLFASPSRAEGMPFAMLEALASGLPVAASDIPGQAAVGRGVGACRLAPLEPQAFAEAVASLLDRDPEQAARDSAEGVELVRSRYGLHGWAERLLSVYDELLPSNST